MRARNWRGSCCTIRSLKGKPPVFAGRVDEKDLARGGVPLGEIHPELVDSKGSGNLKQEPFTWDLLKERKVEILFLATPHEQSREWVPDALDHGLKVIDLSGAWRLTEAANRAVYAFEDDGTELAAATQAQAVYGMPELHRKEIAGARLVANPGLLCDIGDFAVEAFGGCGAGGSGAWNCCGCEERRERRGQSADGEDALYVCGGQSFGVWRVYASAHGRTAGADRRDGERDCFYAAPAADSAGNSGDDLCEIQHAADAGRA